MKKAYLITKRATDITLSLVSIVVLSPILLLTSLLLWATGEHEIIYRQRRVGKAYKPINVYKFVTMRRDSERYGTITAKNDPRVLPVGKVLRKTKINELPQLFNVLFGHMSIVGPRPLVESEVEMYPDSCRDVIYDSNQPGLTGIGSLFFRDEDELIAGTGKPPEQAYKEDIMPLKGTLEAWYRDYKSFRVDAKIVALTAWAIISAETVPVVKAFSGETGIPSDTIAEYAALAQDQKD